MYPAPIELSFLVFRPIDPQNIDENLGRELETDVGGVRCPDDTKSAGDDAGKGKSEGHAGHEEFLAATEVYLEERHVDNGGEEEEEHEDGGEGCVD
ncbi:hypothetical protein BPOR_0721g00020 [Botrytis porri]|uniref:Uncharacterized protein n=1 Tax=Botrytis porri TaxID=87229 RepID=A0A4Z1KHJ3_9HELO|nr:hypothetical protein BPOR_0721g00020 [Botrytis porri]